MTWFAVALVGPILYALTNHLDKILLEKYFKEGGVGTLILFSSLLSVLAIPFVFLGDPTVLDVDIFSIFILALVGILNVGVLYFYLKALEDEEASIAIVFYQLVPVFGLGLGYVILDEVLTQIELIAMAIIILGTTIIAFEIDNENKFKLRKKTIMYMLLAVTCWATESVIFKAVALEENVWRTLFWEHVMLVLVGVCIYLLVPTYRRHFNTALKVNTKGILALNFLNEAIYMVGNIVVSFAYLMAPIALILLAESFQPIFVFLIGIFLTIFLPSVSVENIEAKNLWQKFIAIAITGIGTYLLSLS